MRNAEGGTKQSRFWGETTAFLALFLDNAGVLIFLNAILVFTPSTIGIAYAVSVTFGEGTVTK